MNNINNYFYKKTNKNLLFLLLFSVNIYHIHILLFLLVNHLKLVLLVKLVSLIKQRKKSILR